MAKKKNRIPKRIAHGCPKTCPKCKNLPKKKGRVIAVFRTWKPTNRVSCEIIHQDESICRITYDYE